MVATAGVQVKNNTYPGWSYLLAGGRYLSRRGIYESYPGPPTPYSEFDGGKVHVQVGGDLWVTQLRHVISYKVDRYTGRSTVWPLDAGVEWTYYHYGMTDDPNYLPGHIFRSTNDPVAWVHRRDHSGVAPNMLTPLDNPYLNGTVVVCDAMFIHSPAPTLGHTAWVGYSLRPAGTVLDAPAAACAVRLTIWDPAQPSFARFWDSDALTDQFEWDGWLYGSGGTDYQNASRLQCSDYFMRISWRTRDTVWDGYVCQRDVRTMMKDEERIIVDVHAEGTDPPALIRQISAGGVENPVHTAIIGVYSNPSSYFPCTVSMEGGTGKEPPVYPYLGRNYKLGHKVDAQISLGGHTYTAGDPQPLVLNVGGWVRGLLRSSNRVQTATVLIAIGNGPPLPYNVEFAAPTMNLVMPAHLYPQTPDTVSVTLTLAGPAPRSVPGHELLFYVSGLTFKSGTHLDWMTDAYLKNRPLRLDRFVQIRTDHSDPNHELNITEFTDDDGLAAATITIVEPLLGIDKVEVKVLDGSVYEQ